MAYTDGALQGRHFVCPKALLFHGRLLITYSRWQPWYARAVARYLVSNYRLTLYPYSDLTIYEIGAGNGTLMRGILDYVAAHEPEIYSRTQYHTIEISRRLASHQRLRAGPHASQVTVHERSIFDWKAEDRVSEPVYVLAFEVLDNLAHDVVRYTTDTLKPVQSIVAVDSTGDFHERFAPIADPLIKRFLKLRLRPPPISSPILGKILSSLPFAPNLSKPYFIPTKSLSLIDTLRRVFPAHRPLFTDFSSLPDAVEGHMAPVVQTRFQGQTVACSTMLVSRGHFDIFFPTDFRLLRNMYTSLMSNENDFFSPRKLGVRGGGGSKSGLPRLRVRSHREFLEEYGETQRTRLRDGSNPMLEYYANQSFLY
jgi:hypothetical protein